MLERMESNYSEMFAGLLAIGHVTVWLQSKSQEHCEIILSKKLKT